MSTTPSSTGTMTDARGETAGGGALREPVGDPDRPSAGKEQSRPVQPTCRCPARAGRAGAVAMPPGQSRSRSGTLTTKIACQPTVCSSRPPNVGPKTGASTIGTPMAAHDLGQVLPTGRLDQDGQPGRDEHAATDALQHPKGDELGCRGRQCAEARADCEHGESEQVDAERAVAADRPSREWDDGGERQQVRRDHPLDGVEWARAGPATGCRGRR